jgi:glycosyltransferase involved in cell wall biosynthesis
LTPIHSESSPSTSPPDKTRSETITFLVYSPYPRYSGGRENWLYNISGALVRRGRSVTIISHASNRANFYPPVAGVETIPLASIRYLDRAFFWANRLSLGLARFIDTLLVYPITASVYLARKKPAVLVCMNSIPEGLAAALARRRYVVSVRGNVPAEMSRSFRPLESALKALERSVLRRAVRVLANGSDTQQRLRADGIASEVVPNGVDLARFRSPAPQAAIAGRMIQAARGRQVIAVIGTLRPIKGTDEALVTAAELRRLGAEFLMAFAGKGDVDHYRRLAHAQHLDDAVEFFGETSDVPAVLQHSDIFLALSGGSGLSMAVLEAMAAGVVVVALDSPVYAQLIDDGVNGVLSPSADLASWCLRLLRDADLRRRLGAEGSRTADQYDWEVVAERLSSVLGR